MSQINQEGAAFKIDGVQLVDQAFFIDLFPNDEIFSLGNPVYNGWKFTNILHRSRSFPSLLVEHGQTDVGLKFTRCFYLKHTIYSIPIRLIQQYKEKIASQPTITESDYRISVVFTSYPLIPLPTLNK
jgi:hypothetical protein